MEMFAFDNSIFLWSLNTSSLIFDAMKLKEISHGYEFRTIAHLDGFNIGIKLSMSKIIKRF